MTSFICRRSQHTLFWPFCLKPKKKTFQIYNQDHGLTNRGAFCMRFREIENSRTVLLEAISLVLWIPYFPKKNILHDKNLTFSISTRRFSAVGFLGLFKTFKTQRQKSCWCITMPKECQQFSKMRLRNGQKLFNGKKALRVHKQAYYNKK